MRMLLETEGEALSDRQHQADWLRIPTGRAGAFEDRALSTPAKGTFPREGGVKKILVATDFSAGSATAAEEGAVLARQRGAGLVLLHVIDSCPSEAFEHSGSAADLMLRLRQEAATRLNRLVEALQDTHVELQPALAEGLPGEVIAEWSHGADLLVLDAGHGRQSLGKFFSKGTLQTVLESAACPVLVVRQKARSGRDCAGR
jgi:nucleotide-binding universal stress UspA family protein